MTLGGEKASVQKPFVRYAIDAGWTYLSPEEALTLRRGLTSPVLDSVLVDHLQRLNPGIVDHRRAEDIVKRLGIARSHGRFSTEVREEGNQTNHEHERVDDQEDDRDDPFDRGH